MADKKININALGQAIDTSWGRSSTPQAASYSVKLTMLGGDRLLATYQAIVNFGTEREMLDMRRRYDEESKSITNAVIKKVKETYKDLADSAITLKEETTEPSLEITGVTFHNPKRTAYYRRKTIFGIG